MIRETALALAAITAAYQLVGPRSQDRSVRFETDGAFCGAWLVAVAAWLVTAAIARRRRRPPAERSARPARAQRRQLFFLLVVWGLMFAGFAALHTAAYRAFLARMSDDLRRTSPEPHATPVPPLPPDLHRLLGWGHRTGDCPALSYAFAPREKRAGVRRIGFFGCSFTRGREVVPGHELPSFVAREIAGRGRPDVEVVNFGVGAYGMHQSVLMWDRVGRHHDLDDVVFHPLEYHVDRDTSFVFSERDFGPVHARYVLDGDGVRLVEPAGASQEEALARYFGLPPVWSYLRHDLRLPPWARALLPGPQAPPNPLYYRFFSPGGPEAEILETWVHLWRTVARTQKRVTILCREKNIFDLRERLKDVPNIRFLLTRTHPVISRNRAIYEAPRGHRSALGNELVARELVDFLDGTPGPPDTVELLDATPAQPSAAAPGPLRDGARFTLDDQPAARVMDGDRPLRLTGTGIASLLLIRTGGTIVALPLPFGLTDGAAVRARVTSPTGAGEVELGTVRGGAGVVGWLVPAPGGPRPGPDPWFPHVSSTVLTRVEVLDPGPVTFAVVIGGREVPGTVRRASSALRGLIAGPRHTRLWICELAPLHRLAAAEDQYVDVRRLPEGGWFSFEQDGVRIPVLRYRKARL